MGGGIAGGSERSGDCGERRGRGRSIDDSHSEGDAARGQHDHDQDDGQPDMPVDPQRFQIPASRTAAIFDNAFNRAQHFTRFRRVNPPQQIARFHILLRLDEFADTFQSFVSHRLPIHQLVSR